MHGHLNVKRVYLRVSLWLSDQTTIMKLNKIDRVVIVMQKQSNFCVLSNKLLNINYIILPHFLLMVTVI